MRVSRYYHLLSLEGKLKERDSKGESSNEPLRRNGGSVSSGGADGSGSRRRGGGRVGRNGGVGRGSRAGRIGRRSRVGRVGRRGGIRRGRGRGGADGDFASVRVRGSAVTSVGADKGAGDEADSAPGRARSAAEIDRSEAQIQGAKRSVQGAAQLRESASQVGVGSQEDLNVGQGREEDGRDGSGKSGIVGEVQVGDIGDVSCDGKIVESVVRQIKSELKRVGGGVDEGSVGEDNGASESVSGSIQRKPDVVLVGLNGAVDHLGQVDGTNERVSANIEVQISQAASNISGKRARQAAVSEGKGESAPVSR